MLHHNRQRAYGEASVRRYAVDAFTGGLNMAQDEQIIRSGQSSAAYNVEMVDGALRRCSGFSAPVKYSHDLGREAPIPALPQADCRLYVLRTAHGEQLVAWGSSGFYVEKADTTFGRIGWQKCTCTAERTGKSDYCVHYKIGSVPAMLLGNEKDGMFYIDSVACAPQAVQNSKKLWAGTLHYERLFAVGDESDHNRVRFSAQYDPKDFTVSYDKGGYIDFLKDKGEALEILSHANSIFVFWQYGIARIKAYSYQDEFTAAEVYESISPILRGSVQACGEYVIFAAKDGVYAFNGTDAVRVSDPLEKLFEASRDVLQEAASAFFGGKYYLSAVMRLPGEKKTEKLLLVFDLKSRRWQMYRDIPVRQFVPLHNHGEDRLLAVMDDGRLCMPDSAAQDYVGKPIHACWNMPVSNLGMPEAEKELRELHATVSGSGRLRFTVFTERESEQAEVELHESQRVISCPLHLKGRLVGLRVENLSGNDFKLSAPALLYRAERGRMRRV